MTSRPSPGAGHPPGRRIGAPHPLFARLYVRLSGSMEESGAAEHRQRLLAGLQGSVLEVGAGHGLNFAHYPSTVTRVRAVEPEPYLRRAAEEAATRAPVPVTVVDGVAEQLPADNDSYDAVVVTLVLCSVGDQDTALAEIRRVLRPGGELRFFEHVRATTPGLRRVQRVLDATIWPRIAGGCHTGRDTVAAIERAGFTLERLERIRFPDVRPTLPTTPHVVGVARTAGPVTAREA